MLHDSCGSGFDMNASVHSDKDFGGRGSCMCLDKRLD